MDALAVANRISTTPVARLAHRLTRPRVFIMAIVLIAMGFYLIFPVFLLLVISFNTAYDVFFGPVQWGLANWRVAFTQPGILSALGNTFMVWGLTMGISMPSAVLISWVLARTRIPQSNGIEFMFWIAYMIPSLATTFGWITLMDPDLGMLNTLLLQLPFVDQAPFNIYSVPGIVWVHLMGNGIALKVMLLTPAFRNMDASFEEAAKVGGATNVMTMVRVTLPLMVVPITLVFALQLMKMFTSFETELLLGTHFNFFVYSTYIFNLVRMDPPAYGQATVLASLTMLGIALIIPFQRWVLQRKRYTTISAGFRPGLIDLGRWKYAILAALSVLIFILTLAPMASLIMGSFMFKAGYFGLVNDFTTLHWESVLTHRVFLKAATVTMALGIMAAIASPLLFSLLAYIIVRTNWRGRGALDWIIWVSGAIPGILGGLGLLVLFLWTPGLTFLFGTIWALLIVVIISGNTTGTNIMKTTLIQIGQDMEDAARISGAGWIRTYYRIWIPLVMRTLVLLATMNFAHAVGTTSSIILLTSRDTMTLSILALEYQLAGGALESASIVAIILMFLTMGIAITLRALGLRMAVQHS